RVPAAGLRQDPRNRRAHLIDINSWIDQGRLTVEWTFGSNHHSPDTIAALAQRFLDELTRLIAFGRRSVPDGHAGFAMAGLDADALQVALAQVSFHGAD
ncbi:MAG: hypothetical protein KIT73_10105, partial [Burkholderiales bacterium]|nr:hypothetical protein [Burkholderiales bacterium]